MADPLHFGNWGGMSSKVIWLLFGILLSTLSVTGAYVFAKRVAEGGPVASRLFSGYWQQMGLWAYLCCALILTAFVAWPLREY